MTEHVAPVWSLGILAGGTSSRMGQDKATLEIDPGRPLYLHMLDRLAPPGIPRLLGIRDEDAARALPVPDSTVRYIPDLLSGQGPFSSLCALLKATTTPWLLVVPVDQILLPVDLGQRMLRASRSLDAVLVKNGGRTQPFPALIATECVSELIECFGQGQRRADCWHDKVAAAEVPLDQLFPSEEPEGFFWNANTPAELAVARESLRAGKFVGPMDG